MAYLPNYIDDKGRAVLPDGISEISCEAFKDLTGLTSITIPDSVTRIGYSAFEGCTSLTSITIPDSVTRIDYSTFEGCTSLTSIVIPDSVKEIGKLAFKSCTSLTSITIPDSVTEIGRWAFSGCISLTSIIIPNSITKINIEAFKGCTSLTSIIIPDSVTRIDNSAFSDCTGLTSITIPDSVTEIGNRAFSGCTGLTSITIPDSVTEIGDGAFKGCKRLAGNNDFVIIRDTIYSYHGNATSIDIPDNVTEISNSAFSGCENLTSITIPDSVTKIGNSAFSDCTGLTSIIIPDSVTKISSYAFSGCTELTSIIIPDSVTEIGTNAFYGCSKLSVICSEGSYAEQHCIQNSIHFIYDYQYKAFNGLLPPGFKKLASPFLADEEKPFVFISYSHKDRDEVLGIIKTLYESGWKVWYDEGLTIGDRYDETLENHVRDCSAFLLFVTENSLNSVYCKENEIPWAIQYGKPIIRCVLDEGIDYPIKEDAVSATVLPSETESALEKIEGLTKGEKRIAKGISVVVNPADRDEANGDGFAYCLYADQNTAVIKSILLEIKNSGCCLYNASGEGEDIEKLQNSACLIVFLDKAFLADEHLTDILIKEYQAGKDLAVCMIESIEDSDLPRELIGLHKMQWLNFAYGITDDMNTKLFRHLQKRGCRNTTILPGFDYKKTEKGIIIKKYTGLDPNPRIENEYGGIPVIAISDEAFRNNPYIKTVTLPNSITKISSFTFESCGSLTSFEIPDSVTEINEEAFESCISLTSVTIPDSVTTIREAAFRFCESLASVVIPDSVTEIGRYAFKCCYGLTSITIPNNKTKIDDEAFSYCTSLTSIIIPDSVTEIGGGAFIGCASLTSIVIPDSVTEIGGEAFRDCPNLTVTCSPDSEAWKYCKSNGIRVTASSDN